MAPRFAVRGGWKPVGAGPGSGSRSSWVAEPPPGECEEPQDCGEALVARDRERNDSTENLLGPQSGIRRRCVVGLRQEPPAAVAPIATDQSVRDQSVAYGRKKDKDIAGPVPGHAAHDHRLPMDEMRCHAIAGDAHGQEIGGRGTEHLTQGDDVPSLHSPSVLLWLRLLPGQRVVGVEADLDGGRGHCGLIRIGSGEALILPLILGGRNLRPAPVVLATSAGIGTSCCPLSYVAQPRTCVFVLLAPAVAPVRRVSGV